MQGPCEHCGNSEKELWTGQCAYVGEWPSREAFVESTFDPPCACDDYDEGQRELARRNITFWLAMGLLIGVPIVAFVLR
jgi:hypothetical protein